jgi:hypothetical protein
MNRMNAFLIGMSWCDPEEVAAYKSAGLDDDPRCSTGVFVVAENSDEAVKWANSVAKEFMGYFFRGEQYAIESLELFCWVEQEPELSSWKHCLDFFQRVSLGEYPDFQKMTPQAYSDWCKRMGLSQ